MKSYLCVPFEKKDEVKAAGARWDKDKKMWYVLDNHNEILLKYDMKYLNVTYDEKETVKSNGAQWDPINKSWYTYISNQSLKKFMSP